jgi:hypothetical protein
VRASVATRGRPTTEDFVVKDMKNDSSPAENGCMVLPVGHSNVMMAKQGHVETFCKIDEFSNFEVPVGTNQAAIKQQMKVCEQDLANKYCTSFFPPPSSCFGASGTPTPMPPMVANKRRVTGTLPSVGSDARKCMNHF